LRDRPFRGVLHEVEDANERGVHERLSLLVDERDREGDVDPGDPVEALLGEQNVRDLLQQGPPHDLGRLLVEPGATGDRGLGRAYLDPEQAVEDLVELLFEPLDTLLEEEHGLLGGPIDGGPEEDGPGDALPGAALLEVVAERAAEVGPDAAGGHRVLKVGEGVHAVLPGRGRPRGN